MDYQHSRSENYSVVQCVTCGEDLHSIYDPAIRDTCEPCGGTSKVIEERKEMRARLGLYPTLTVYRSDKVGTLYGSDAGRPF